MEFQVNLPNISNADANILPFFITSYGANSDLPPLERPKGYLDYHIVYTLSGIGVFEFENETVKLEPETILYFSNNIPYKQYNGSSDDWSVYWVTFNTNSDFFKHLDLPDITFCKLDCFEEIAKIAFNRKTTDIDKFEQVYISSQLYTVLSKLSKQLHKNTSSNEIQKLSGAVTMMEQDYMNDISLQTLATACSLSQYYFCRIFKRMYGKTPLKYLLDIRIAKSKTMLLNKNYTIEKVAKLCGFNDSSYFVSVFKKQEGITPNVYKQLYGF